MRPPHSHSHPRRCPTPTGRHVYSEDAEPFLFSFFADVAQLPAVIQAMVQAQAEVRPACGAGQVDGWRQAGLNQGAAPAWCSMLSLALSRTDAARHGGGGHSGRALARVWSPVDARSPRRAGQAQVRGRGRRPLWQSCTAYRRCCTGSLCRCACRAHPPSLAAAEERMERYRRLGEDAWAAAADCHTAFISVRCAPLAAAVRHEAQAWVGGIANVLAEADARRLEALREQVRRALLRRWCAGALPTTSKTPHCHRSLF